MPFFNNNNGISIKSTNSSTGTACIYTRAVEWAEIIEQPNKTNMLTRKDFEGLDVGTEITTLDNRVYKFNHIVNDLVFMITVNNTASIVSIDYMNQHYFTIQKPKQYNHLGWEIGDYSGKNVWVKLSTKSLDDAFEKEFAYLLKSINAEYFVTEEGFIAKYAVQLTEVNTQNMKVK